MAHRGGGILKALVIVVIIGAAGYVVWRRVQAEKAQEAQGQGGTPAAAGERQEAVEGLFRGLDPIPVKAVAAVRGILVQTVHAEGRAQPARQVALAAQVSGRLERILVREGDSVRQGQVLMELEDEEYRQNLDEAKANLLSAQADYARSLEQTDVVRQAGLTIPSLPVDETQLSRLEQQWHQAEADLAAGRIDEKTFRDIELEYQTARILAGKEKGNILKANVQMRQIQVERAQRNLERTRVQAPFTGRVADLKVAVGQYLGSSTELLTLLDVSTMRVDVDVLESEIAPIRAGRRAEVRFTALPDEVFASQVVSVNPMIDPNSRTGRVRLELSNPQGRITPGMFARTRIFARDIPDVVMVPLDAIVERDERTLVFQVERSTDESKPDIVKWRYVQLGERNDTHVIILPETEDPHAGVAAGMLVCVEGHISLQHDSPVRLVEILEPDILKP
jgi:membrane fusion protein (multidrug efflux system)